MKRLPQFDVFKAGIIGGTPLGAYLETIVAETHRHAKHIAQRTHGRGVVVLPAGRGGSAAAQKTVTVRDPRSRGAHPRSSPALRNRR